MALYEGPSHGQPGVLQENRASFGFAFLDAAAGRFYVGTAEDDAGRSTLGALLTQVSSAVNCSAAANPSMSPR